MTEDTDPNDDTGMTEDIDRDAGDPGFSANELQLLGCVLDTLIPPSDDGRLPGAGELALAARVRDALAGTPELRPLVVQGLSALEELASHRGEGSFESLPAPERAETLNELAATQPAFVPGLLFHAYAAYYHHDTVVEALGLEPRPPHPDGYELEPGDLGLLDAVRGRQGLFRDC